MEIKRIDSDQFFDNINKIQSGPRRYTVLDSGDLGERWRITAFVLNLLSKIGLYSFPTAKELEARYIRMLDRHHVEITGSVPLHDHKKFESARKICLSYKSPLCESLKKLLNEHGVRTIELFLQRPENAPDHRPTLRYLESLGKIREYRWKNRYLKPQFAKEANQELDRILREKVGLLVQESHEKGAPQIVKRLQTIRDIVLKMPEANSRELLQPIDRALQHVLTLKWLEAVDLIQDIEKRRDSFSDPSDVADYLTKQLKLDDECQKQFKEDLNRYYGSYCSDGQLARAVYVNENLMEEMLPEAQRIHIKRAVRAHCGANGPLSNLFKTMLSQTALALFADPLVRAKVEHLEKADEQEFKIDDAYALHIRHINPVAQSFDFSGKYVLILNCNGRYMSSTKYDWGGTVTIQEGRVVISRQQTGDNDSLPTASYETAVSH